MTQETQQDPDGWKAVPLTEAIGPKLTEAIVKGRPLKELAEDLTVGGLDKFTRSHRLTDLSKLGGTTARKIEDALAEFWRRNPHWSPLAKKKRKGAR